MTEQWERAPDGARSTDATDLFAGIGTHGYQDLAPHPSFVARAAIWRDQRAGLISIAEAQRRSAAIGVPPERKARPAAGNVAPPRPRHARSAPHGSRQYANAMATTAARDDRLTPNAKALLQVLRARCGRGRQTTTTKGTLAAVMSRSARTIRRYLGDLERLGYIATAVRATGRGLHIGLLVTITEKVLPFFDEDAGLRRWLGEVSTLASLPFSAASPRDQGVTFLTPKNQIRKDSFSQLKERLLRGRQGAALAPS